MKLSGLNEYIQTAAALGAILGLIIVGFELRQSNRIATQQAVSNNWSNWISSTIAEIESGVSKTRAKSMTNPDDLTLEEKINLDLLLQVYVYAYHHDYTVLYWDNSSELAEEVLEELVRDVPIMFGSRFSRAWLQENKHWMNTDIVTAIERGLKDAPVGSDLKYYGRIDALAATL
jgi:hypothetical protein